MATEKQSNRRQILLGVLALGVVSCALCAAIVVWYQRDLAQTADQFGETIVAMCDPIRGGEANLANLPADATYPLQIVVFRESQRFTGSFHSDLRDEWRAETGEDVDVVVCIGDTQRRLVEECAYGDANDSPEDAAVIERFQRYNEVVLFNPQTSTRIATLTVDGAMPDECPDSIFAEDGEERVITGNEVTFADFETALIPYIEQ